MNEDLRDFELNKDDQDSLLGRVGAGRPRWPWIVGVIVLVLALVAFLWNRQGAEDGSSVVGGPSVPTDAEPEAAARVETDLMMGEVPALVDSDEWLQGIVSQLSSHPQMAEWLVTPELIRGFVVVVDNIAEGVGPRPHLETVAPGKSFSVTESDGSYYVDPSSYDRFDLLIDVIESLDADGTAQLYAAIRPLCEQAYQDLGYRGEDFEPTLERAIARLLDVPVVDGPIELVPKVTAYEFKDAELEEVSPASKQFLRLGPDNLRRLQAKARALVQAIGLEV